MSTVAALRFFFEEQVEFRLKDGTPVEGSVFIGETIGIGRKLVLLISRKVDPFARLRISSCAALAQKRRNRFDNSPLGFMAMKPWLMATGTWATARYPIGALDDRRTVPGGSRPEPICERPASVTSLSVSRRTGVDNRDKSLGVAQ